MQNIAEDQLGLASPIITNVSLPTVELGKLGEKSTVQHLSPEVVDSNGTQCAPANIETPVCSPVGLTPHEQKSEARPASPSERVKGILRGFCLVLDDHGVPQAVMDSFKDQVTTYLTVPDEKVFFKRAKYLTVAPMAQYLKCDAPKIPDLAFNPKGLWASWSRQRLRVFNRRNTHLWYSFLQAKRAALPLSADLVLTTYLEHRAAMEQADPIDGSTLETVMKELKPVLKRIRKQLQRTLRQDDEGHLVMEAKHVASTRACFEASRAKGGQLGHIISLMPELIACNPLSQEPVEPDLVRTTFYPRCAVNGVIHEDCLVEEYEYVEAQARWKDFLLAKVPEYETKVSTRELVHDGETYIIVTQRPCRLKCTIQAVLEPLKVRVISKGQAVPYYLSKPLQKAMHDVMRDMPCFRLIGRPMCPTDLMDLAQERVEGGEGQYEWFSIDYSAATDKLSAKLSRSILEFLVEDQDPSVAAMWRAVLAPHMCHYPFPYNLEVAPVRQENGQLMGSILSFPILCLANLGLYLAAIRDDKRPLRQKLAGVLVNGDDMLYVARRSRWETHVELGSRVGLSMSPGKAYHHPIYANANSSCYHYDLSNPRSTPWSIPFLNSGLYFGQSKVLGGDDQDVQKSIASTISELLAGSRRPCDTLSAFLRRHRQEIDAECKGRNLFIPECFGGMGVVPPLGWRTEINNVQAAVATALYRDNPFLHKGGQPARGLVPKEAPQPLSAPWLAGLLFTKNEEGELEMTRPEKERGERLRLNAASRSLLKRGGIKHGSWMMIPAVVTTVNRHQQGWYDREFRSWDPLSDEDFSLVQRDRQFAVRTRRTKLEDPTPWQKLSADLGRLFDEEDLCTGVPSSTWVYCPIRC